MGPSPVQPWCVTAPATEGDIDHIYLDIPGHGATMGAFAAWRSTNTVRQGAREDGRAWKMGNRESKFLLDGAQSVILPQVTFGIAVRMAVMSTLAGRVN